MKGRKIIATMLAAATALTISGVTTQIQTRAADDPVTALLQQKADSFTYLRDSDETYHGTYEDRWIEDDTLDEGGYSYPNWYDAEDSVPLEPLGYQIADFDGDGQNELLVINLDGHSTGEYGDDLYSYYVVPQMYEVMDGEVQLSDEYEVNDIGAGLNMVEDTASFDAYTFDKGGKKYICLEENYCAYISADGDGYDFYELTYDGSDFNKTFSASNEASSPDVDFDYDSSLLYNGLKDYHDKAKINVDFRSVYTFGSRVSIYVPKKSFIAGSDRSATGNYEDGYSSSDITFAVHSKDADTEKLISDSKYKKMLKSAKKKIKSRKVEKFEQTTMEISSVTLGNKHKKNGTNSFIVKVTNLKQKGTTYYVTLQDAKGRKIKTFKSKTNKIKVTGIKKNKTYTLSPFAKAKIDGKTREATGIDFSTYTWR